MTRTADADSGSRWEHCERRADDPPLTVPAPDVVHAGRLFCFTGVFEFGPRIQCHEAVVSRGGEAIKG